MGNPAFRGNVLPLSAAARQRAASTGDPFVTHDPNDPSLHTHDAAPVKTPTEARQGARGNRVLMVLIAGCVLVVAVFFLLYSTSSVEHPPPTLPIGEQAQPTGPSDQAAPPNATPPEPSRTDLPPKGENAPAQTAPQGSESTPAPEGAPTQSPAPESPVQPGPAPGGTAPPAPSSQ